MMLPKDPFCAECGCEILCKEEIGDIRFEETFKPKKKPTMFICWACVEEEETALIKFLDSEECQLEIQFNKWAKEQNESRI